MLALIFISTYVTASISRHLYNREEIELLASTNIVANLIAEDIKSNPKKIEEVIADVNLTSPTRIIVTDIHARVLYDSGINNNIKGKVFVKEEIIDAIEGKDIVSTNREKDVGSVVQAAASIISNSETVGAVYMTNVATATDDFIKDIKWLLNVISVIVCILAGVLSAVMADVVVTPIEKLTSRLSKVEFGAGAELVKF